MHAPHRRRLAAGGPMRPAAVGLAALVLVLSGPAALAQPDPGQPAAARDPAVAEPDAETPRDESPTFLDSVTISANVRPAAVRDTPGVVSVIDSETIQERMIEDFSDLVKYEPGVYVENSVTRLGLNGFNIRGIGGNRVMTMVDGVQTSEQFDFGPFNVHQAGLDVDVLKTVEIVRSANSALYGSDALGGVVSLFTKDPADYLQDQRFYTGAKTTWDSRAGDLGVNLTLAGGNERVQASVFTSLNRGREIGKPGHRPHAGRNPHRAESAGRGRPAGSGQAGLQRIARQPVAHHRRAVRLPRRDGLALEQPAARLREILLSHQRLGRRRHAEAPAALARPHPRRPRDRPAVVAGVRAAQRHSPGRRRRSGDVRLRPDVPVDAPRHPRLRAGRLRRFGAGSAVAGQPGRRHADHVRRQLQDRLLRHAARPDRDRYRHRTAGGDRPGLPEQVLPGERRGRSRRLSPGRYPVRPHHPRARRALRPLLARRQPGRPGVPLERQPGSGRLLGRRPVAQDRHDGAVDRRGDAARAVRGRIPGASLQRRQHRLRQSPRRLYDAAEHGAPGGDERQSRGRHPDRVRPRQLRIQRVLEPVRRLHRADRHRLQPPDPAARVPEPEPRSSPDRRGRAARRVVSDRQRDDSGQLRAESTARRFCRAPRTVCRWPRRRRSAPSHRTKAWSDSGTCNRRAAGAASSR